MAVLNYLQGSGRDRKNRNRTKKKSSNVNTSVEKKPSQKTIEKTVNTPTAQNIVKIGDFSIYEENDSNDEYDFIVDTDNQGFPISDQVKTIIKNVEQENSKKCTSLGCLICIKGKLSSNDVLKFKTLNEFFVYLEYQLGKYPLDSNVEVARNWEDYTKLKNHLNESYDNNIEYNFKSHRYICKFCFSSLITHTGGFNKIFKTLNVNTRVLKNNCYQKKQQVEEGVETEKENSNDVDDTKKEDDDDNINKSEIGIFFSLNYR